MFSLWLKTVKDNWTENILNRKRQDEMQQKKHKHSHVHITTHIVYS